MRFTLVVNMERMNSDVSMVDVLNHVTEMAQMADQAGFDIVWAAEHHALEMTISPGPFQLLAHFAAHTDRIRLGTAVVVAPYWHPIKLAGEAALLDLISGGRLEFGIGKGAYQREFDRMTPGLHPNIGVPMMVEMLPAVKQLWQGDYEHQGEYWQFPAATSVPKPVQQPHPPIKDRRNNRPICVVRGVLVWSLSGSLSVRARTFRDRSDSIWSRLRSEHGNTGVGRGAWEVRRGGAVAYPWAQSGHVQ